MLGAAALLAVAGQVLWAVVLAALVLLTRVLLRVLGC
jgi:hypothetical protein